MSLLILAHILLREPLKLLVVFNFELEFLRLRVVLYMLIFISYTSPS